MSEEKNALVPVEEPRVYEGEICDDDNLRRDYAFRIGSSWQKSIENIFETGRLILETKEKIGHGKFVEMCAFDLPFSDSTALRLMKIARDQRLLDLAQSVKELPAPDGEVGEYEYPRPRRGLPASWRTLYELSQLSDDQFQHAVENGLIHANLGTRDAVRLKTLPIGQPGLGTRSVRQPPRKKPDETGEEQAPEAPKGRNDVTLTLTLTAAEVLLLRDIYLNVIDTPMVRTWLEEHYPWQQEPRLPFPFPGTHDLAHKLNKAAETVLPGGDQ
ncbi:MAG: hypothetical protein HQL79_08615 [Magnetococcales bacterium]|nr:hypothetical protein [Magnetococcales bacterium]